MKISKKAEYAMRAVIGIARNPRNIPLQISELSNSESIPIKFLEQILLSLKKAGTLRSKRGASGGYYLEKDPSEISLGSILEIIDGPFDPIGLATGNRPGTGLEECFSDLSEIVINHLDQCSIQDIIEKEKPEGLLAFEI
jgi:Rrf2 family protein